MRPLILPALIALATGCSQPFTAAGDGCVDEDGDWYCAELEGLEHDCDDADPAVYPGAGDVWYDGVDGDCDGADDYDADADGYASDVYGGADCDDTDPNVSPAISETWYDGIDSDCDGADDYDVDGDGYPGGDDGTDCDDSDDSIYPGAEDTWYDSVDSDCAGNSDFDADGDGFDSGEFEGPDCDDSDPDIHPGADDPLDGIDSDCDGTYEEAVDMDLDGYTTVDDCDDDDASVYPGAEDTWYDGVDSDCDEADDYDADGDGHQSDDYGGDDCDDDDDSVNPDASETWYDGIDADCDEASDYDADADGYDSQVYGGWDCDDADDAVSPGAEDTWYDGVDSDCDGADDYDADGDGYQSDDYGGDDCEDADATAYPGAVETIGDSTDGDCDGGDDTSSFTLLSLSGSTDLQGPRLTQSNDGVIVAVSTQGYTGGSLTGVHWHYLDPDQPWSGSIGNQDWGYSGTYAIGTGYDIVADGDWVMEVYTLYEYVSGPLDNVWLRYAVTHKTLGYHELGGYLDTSYISDWDDIDLSYDGTNIGVVACESTSAYQWTAYMTGSFSDFFNDTHDLASTYLEGGEVCITREPSGLVYAANAADNDTYIYSYSYSPSGSSLSSYSSFTGAVDDMDWTYHGSASSYAHASVSGTNLVMRDSSSSTSITSSGSGVKVQADYNGSDLYAVYADSSGDAWLVYGTISGGFTEVALSTGLTTVEDVDVFVTDSGNLVIAAQGADQLSVMGAAL